MKQTFQTKSSLLLPFLLLVILSSCYKNEEGCLDQFASNFSFSADDPCEDCCKYPNLKITFSHNFDSLKMRLNDTLTLDSISYFNVLSISYYLSDISIFPSSGLYEAIDSIEYIDEDTKLSLVNNNALINGLRSNITLNRIKGDATINQVDFNFGLPPEWTVDNFPSISNSNVLSKEAGQLKAGDYCDFNISLIKGVNLNDTLNLNLCDIFIPLSFTSDNLGKITKGADYNKINIAIAYHKLFKNINFNTVDSSSLNLALRENILDIFSVN